MIYQPIPLLPIFGKMCERLSVGTFLCHLYENDLLTQNQSGFSPRDLTIDQLLTIAHDFCLSCGGSPSKETHCFLGLFKGF